MARWSQWTTILAVVLMGLTATLAIMRTAPPEEKQNIVIHDGLVDAKSAKGLTELASANIDKIIGLKLFVETRDSEQYRSILEDDGLAIGWGNPMDAPEVLVVRGKTGTTSAGAYHLVDGFYLIKDGGSQANGALFYEAVPVDEATIRLNPRIRLITRKL